MTPKMAKNSRFRNFPHGEKGNVLLWNYQETKQKTILKAIGAKLCEHGREQQKENRKEKKHIYARSRIAKIGRASCRERV